MVVAASVDVAAVVMTVANDEEEGEEVVETSRAADDEIEPVTAERLGESMAVALVLDDLVLAPLLA